VQRELQIIATDLAVLGHERGATYPDMAWEPKRVFGALAAAYARP